MENNVVIVIDGMYNPPWGRMWDTKDLSKKIQNYVAILNLPLIPVRVLIPLLLCIFDWNPDPQTETEAEFDPNCGEIDLFVAHIFLEFVSVLLVIYLTVNTWSDRPEDGNKWDYLRYYVGSHIDKVRNVCWYSWTSYMLPVAKIVVVVEAIENHYHCKDYFWQYYVITMLVVDSINIGSMVMASFCKGCIQQHKEDQRREPYGV